MSVFSIIKSLLDLGGETPGPIGLVSHVLSGVLTHVWNAVNEGCEMSVAEINNWWAGFDAKSGIGGVRIIHDLPDEAEEKLLDGVKAIGEVLMTWAYGHYGDRPSPATVKAAIGRLVVLSNFEPGDNGHGSSGEDEGTSSGFGAIDGPDIFEVLRISLDKPASVLMTDRIRALTTAVLELDARTRDVAA